MAGVAGTVAAIQRKAIQGKALIQREAIQGEAESEAAVEELFSRKSTFEVTITFLKFS